MEDTTPLLEGTKCILLLGESAMYRYLPETITSSLGAERGSLYYYKSIPTIASFFPQDAVDAKAYEQSLNPLSKDYAPEDSSSDDEDDEGDVKAFGKTRRSNYAFWIRADVRKCKAILQGFKPPTQQPTYKIYPPSSEVIDVLNSYENKFFYFDMETDYEEQNFQCFSFSFDGNVVWSVPVLDFSYKPAYHNYYLILRALCNAIYKNTIVAHNGATFDFFVLGHKYHIPIVRAYDTMIAMHRCFPDIEKSLGHCTSYWTWEKFHKNEDSVAYRTHQQMMDRMRYCGKDVYTMYLVKQAIDSYAKTIPGLERSINDAMSCIRPYLTSTLQGVKCDEQKIASMVSENDGLMYQYNRMIELLIGPDGLKACKAAIKGKAKLFAGSNKQCCEYFHELLKYPVVARSPKTGDPSVGKKALYKLALKHPDNPVISLICAYRATQKETSRLRFLPWINTNENLQECQNTSAQ